MKNRRNYYFPVLDGPRMTRDDKENEIIRRINTIARIKPERLLLFNLGHEATQGFAKRIPNGKLYDIANTKDIDYEVLGPTYKPQKDLPWGNNNIAVGLLRAKQTRSYLRFEQKDSPTDDFVSGDNHLVVYEDRGDIASVITANYVFSINASLLVIPPVQESEINDILESLYLIYSEDSCKPISEKLKSVRERIRWLAKGIPVDNYNLITFITSGLPWGFAFPEVPSTHIFSYPDIGIFIANSVVAEQRGSPGIRVSITIDPNDSKMSETEAIAEHLSSRGTYVRSLCGRQAHVENVSHHLDVFPYDLLLISTHAGEIAGNCLTYHFKDRENIARELIVDMAVGFGVVPGTEMVKVTEFIRFVSLDGVRWDDTEKKKELYVGSAIIDFLEYSKSHDDDRLKIVTRVDVPRVIGAMTLKMYDSNYIPVFHSMADECNPIVFNNACSSWREMSGRFAFGGARAYIGTMFEVTSIEAKELATVFFTKYSERLLLIALWRSQNDVYGETRHPYVTLGTHFTRIRFGRGNIIKYLGSRLQRAARSWRNYSINSSKEGVLKKNAADYAIFLEREYKNFAAKWKL